MGIISVVCLALVLSCSPDKNSSEEDTQEARGPFYSNPVIKTNCPDPSIIDNRERDGYFYAYSTQNGANGTQTVVYLPVWRSRDMISWELVGNAFGGLERPWWVSDSRIWAPDINYINGKYVLYYALGCWDESDRSASGVAWSDSPAGPFTDVGMLVDYETQGVGNSIDPNFFDDGDHNTSSGAVSAPSLEYSLSSCPPMASPSRREPRRSRSAPAWKVPTSTSVAAGTTFSAPRAPAAAGPRALTMVVVARSKNVLGPYVARTGLLLPTAASATRSSPGSALLVGPGHNGEIITDDAGQDWIVYHAFSKVNNYNGRSLCLDKIFWTEDGWPYFSLNTPAISGYGPVLSQS